MSLTLKDVISGENLPEEKLHRSTTKERPTEEIVLNSVSKESVKHAKTQKDPTEDLVELLKPIESAAEIAASGYYIWCEWSKQMWFAHSKLCLDQNFIYRDDLDILTLGEEDAQVHFDWAKERFGRRTEGVYPTRKCYILDNPCNETYEVYYESNYPSVKYGYSTPKGCFIHVYTNRFHRDMSIMELDELYSNSSYKTATELTKKKLTSRDAIIISDGAWMKESCSSSFVYLDDKSVIKRTEGFCPTEPDQAVLIAEINAAYAAFKLCMERSKGNIKYYYDNTSILNVFRNRKTEYIEEVRRYKDLLEKMDTMGYKIEFIELHPKTGEDRDKDNKALQFFHNNCDKECREMCDVFAKDYRDFAVQSNKEGKTYKDFKKEYAPKPKQPNGNKGNYKKR